ncbi:MAG: hypothetical protein JSW47_04935 [Phycisphaerales bacterium]|nr:MAG: hypothetical protein JSW47_04935 [Phycisphaerales bacterium]
MGSLIQQLNRGLLLSRKIHGGHPPYLYRKAWRSLLTLSSNLQGTLPDSLRCKLEAALQAMLDVDERGLMEAAASLEEFAANVAAQSGNGIPQAQADALLAAVRQITMFAQYQPV